MCINISNLFLVATITYLVVTIELYKRIHVKSLKVKVLSLKLTATPRMEWKNWNKDKERNDTY